MKSTERRQNGVLASVGILAIMIVLSVTNLAFSELKKENVMFLFVLVMDIFMRSST